MSTKSDMYLGLIEKKLKLQQDIHRSGTRAFLSSKADEGREYAQNKARELRNTAEDLIERSKEIISSQSDSLSKAVEAGKVVYQREKSKAAGTS